MKRCRQTRSACFYSEINSDLFCKASEEIKYVEQTILQRRINPDYTHTIPELTPHTGVCVCVCAQWGHEVKMDHMSFNHVCLLQVLFVWYILSWYSCHHAGCLRRWSAAGVRPHREHGSWIWRFSRRVVCYVRSKCWGGVQEWSCWEVRWWADCHVRIQNTSCCPPAALPQLWTGSFTCC